jgi:hypothetical protein
MSHDSIKPIGTGETSGATLAHLPIQLAADNQLGSTPNGHILVRREKLHRLVCIVAVFGGRTKNRQPQDNAR